jgi:hypothetical protein
MKLIPVLGDELEAFGLEVTDNFVQVKKNFILIQLLSGNYEMDYSLR